MKKILIAALGMLLGSTGAYALGTNSGTDVTNDAALSYTVGTVTYTADTTAGGTDTFKVDKKVDMVLVTNDTTQQPVVPGATGQVTNFTFTNEGNSDTQHFSFAVDGALAAGTLADYNGQGDDQDDVTVTEVNWTVGANCAPLANGSSTAFPFVLDVPEDCVLTMTVASTIPSPLANTRRMHVELKATAVTDAGGGTTEKIQADIDLANDDRKTEVDVVLADGASTHDGGDTLGNKDKNTGAHDNNPDTAHDGIVSAISGYVIDMPVLAIAKESCVISDPINGDVAAGNHPKRVPGAIIRYMIDIANGGTSDASGITITDNINDTAVMDYASISTTGNNVHTSKGNVACVCANESGGTASHLDHTGAASPEVKFENIEVAKPAAGEAINHTCVSFDITIN